MISYFNYCLSEARSVAYRGGEDCAMAPGSLLSGSLALEALLIGVHSKRHYINVLILIQQIFVND